jgi:hypothetical protein
MNDDQSSHPPQAVKSYAGGIAARTAARQEQRRSNPIFPNLAQAAVTHQAGVSDQTLEEVGRTQREDAGRSADEPRRAELSPETIDGLKNIKRAADQEAARKAAEAAPVAEKAAPALESEDELDADDVALADALRGVRADVIQNDRERKAVALRVQEIDLADGLITGEFTQVVPIVPDKLKVRFRCLTTAENNELRLLLYDTVQKDPRKAQIAQDLLAFYQTVASVMSINDHVYAKHMVIGDPSGRVTFNLAAFEEKVHVFMAFPLPLIASLGTHGAWFEMRVRELFATTDRLKNG